MVEIGRRIERLAQQLDEREEAARSPLIGLAERAPRRMDDLTDSELVVLAELGDRNPSDADPALLSSDWEDGRLVFRIHLTEDRLRELERDGMRDRRSQYGSRPSASATR